MNGFQEEKVSSGLAANSQSSIISDSVNANVESVPTPCLTILIIAPWNMESTRKTIYKVVNES